MYPSDVETLLKSVVSSSSFYSARPYNELIIRKALKNGTFEYYVGRVVQVRKPGAFIIDLDVEALYVGARLSLRWKRKQVGFKNSHIYTVYLLSRTDFSPDVDSQKSRADQRRAYAQHRQSLMVARQQMNEHFERLHIDQTISAEDFKEIRKKLMLKWHPDRFFVSGLSDKFMFDALSKEYTDSIAYIEQWILSRDKRKI